MPEYLTPGVYVEETSFRSRSIEGVATSTFGMAGLTEYGPVPYIANGATVLPTPTLVSSFTEYERAFGGLKIGEDDCQVAFAARAFFTNGGRRLYVSRVFSFPQLPGPAVGIDPAAFGGLDVPVAGPAVLRWKARWPGTASERMKVKVRPVYSKNVVVGGRLVGVAAGAVVVTGAAGASPPVPGGPLPAANTFRVVARRPDATLGYHNGANPVEAVPANSTAFHITLQVEVTFGSRLDVYTELEAADTNHPRSVFRVLEARDPGDEMALVWLDTVNQAASVGERILALLTLSEGAYLSRGKDSEALDADTLKGQPADPDNPLVPALGLGALAEIDDLAIVATPDTVGLQDAQQETAVQNLIDHCEQLRYRIAVVDPPKDSSISEVRTFRSKFDSSYAALYYPWLRIVDPSVKPDPGGPTQMIDVPASGAVAGIYARTDITRGVHKAPANEVVRGMSSFVTNVTYDRQSVLNPEGINALRFFEGRSNRVWGARTMSSDPEWKYVNVRRLFIYLEHSIDRATQWAVFEPNNERLWGSIRQSVEDFLITAWRDGALMGTKPEEAFFVRCDRTTMTQNDLDNGRMICLIGVAPTYPAEFVIFRIGQWTADSRRN